MTETFKKLQALILKSEGKTLEDELKLRECECGRIYKSGQRKLCEENHRYIVREIPITLPRVLKALGIGVKCRILFDGGCVIYMDIDEINFADWNLDHHADRQTEEAQLKLIELLL